MCFREVSLYKPLSPHAKIMIFVTFSAWSLPDPAPCQVPCSIGGGDDDAGAFPISISDSICSDRIQSNRGVLNHWKRFSFVVIDPNARVARTPLVIVVDVAELFVSFSCRLFSMVSPTLNVIPTLHQTMYDLMSKDKSLETMVTIRITLKDSKWSS